MSVFLPAREDKKWVVSTGSDLYGHVVRSKNLDFSKEGYLSLAKKAMVLQSTADDGDFVDVLAIRTDDTYVYVLTKDGMFAATLSSNSLVFTDISASGPDYGLQSDAEFYQSVLHVSGDTTIESWSGGTGGSWTSRVTGLSASFPHPLGVSDHQNYFAIGNGNTVQLRDSSYNLIVTLTIPGQYYVTWIRWRNNYLYIGTRNVKGGEAKMFYWNGSGTAAQGGWGVGADWAYSGCEFSGSMCIITSTGQVKRFNGGGFDTLGETSGSPANLPVYYTPYAWTSSTSDTSLLGKVTSRGMDTDGDILYLNVNGQIRGNATDPQGTYLPQMPSGLWCYDPDVGLYHKAGSNYTKKLLLTPASVNSNYVTFSVVHQAETGDPILAVTISGITGLTQGQTYYAIVDATKTMKLALSKADALAGRHIIISGTPTSDKFSMDVYETVGNGAVINTGAVLVLGRTIPDLFFGTEVLFGATLQTTDLSTERSVLMSLGMGRNSGYAVTPKITSTNITDTFQKIIAKYGLLALLTQGVVLKYRTEERYGFPTQLAFDDLGEASWTSTTTFTVDVRYRDFNGVQVGDEIEIVKGAGAGYLAHITAISVSGNTATVTIDEALPVTAADKMDFIADNWTKLETISSTDNPNFKDPAIGEDNKSKWVQFKIELRGREVDIEQLAIINKVDKGIT